jgi:4-aminobutyrate--pyruvate transaminase
LDIRVNSAEGRDIAFSLHPYTNLKRHEAEGPLVITRGQGVHVYDATGKEYIEAVAGLWSASLGMGGEERLVQAAAKQLRTLPFYHLFAHKSHLPGIDLAEKIIGMLPVPMSKVFFNNSGSEANDSAVKMVRYYNNAIGRPKKKKIIAQIKGYHGVTVAAASLTGLVRNHADFDLPIEGVRHADCPHFYRYGKPDESEEAFATRLAENLEALIVRENPDTVAGFIAEPVQGAGGVIVPPRTYFDKIQPILKRYDILFIADEVICGFGRLGTMFGIESFQIKPDIITLAKALSASYLPISATVISQPLYEAIRDNSDKLGTFAHGYTYSGHPVCAAVALETLRIYEERRIVDHVRAVAPAFQEGARRFAEHPLVGEVRGTGLLAGVELVQDKRTKASFDPKRGVGALVQRHAERQGLIVRALGDTLALSPPLIIERDQIEEIFLRFERALAATAAEMKADF